MTYPLKVRSERRGAVHVLALSGDLGTGSSSGLTEAIERGAADRLSRPRRVVVDLSGVRFIDAVGARALVAVMSQEAGRCPVVLRSLRPALRQVVAAVSPELDVTRWGLVIPHPDAAAEVDADSLTWTLVRRSRKARSNARQTITDTRRTAEMIAATEDRIAATLLQLAPYRRNGHEDVVALGKLARRHADFMRDHAGDAAGVRAGAPNAVTDQRDPAADTLHRSIAFIHEHARDDIRAADIAAAACVSTRAVQLAFRRYLGTTPLGYLRQVRLERVHDELLAAQPARGTVTRIAADWQFTNLGRFTAHYRAAYGVLPSRTLHDAKMAGQPA